MMFESILGYHQSPPGFKIRPGKVFVVSSIQNLLGLTDQAGSHLCVGFSLDPPDDCLGQLGGPHVIRGQGVGYLLDLLGIPLQELAVSAVAVDLEFILEVVVVNTGRHIVCNETPSLSGYLKGLDYILNILEFVYTHHRIPTTI